jgi:hypothetical protein
MFRSALWNGYRGLHRWGKVATGVNLTTHLHLVPRLRKMEAYLHSAMFLDVAAPGRFCAASDCSVWSPRPGLSSRDRRAVVTATRTGPAVDPAQVDSSGNWIVRSLGQTKQTKTVKVRPEHGWAVSGRATALRKVSFGCADQQSQDYCDTSRFAGPSHEAVFLRTACSHAGFLLGLFFHPEDRGDISLRNVGRRRRTTWHYIPEDCPLRQGYWTLCVRVPHM